MIKIINSSKNQDHNIPYDCFPDFILRSPSLPYNFIQPFIDQEDVSENQMIACLNIPVIQEAIFLASPEFYSELEKWSAGNINRQDERDRIRFVLFRYLIRMSTRSTPFGLFAGINTGKWKDKNQIQLEPLTKGERSAQLDMHYLCALAPDLSRLPGIRNQIRFYPNSSIYTVGNKYRYVEYRYDNNKKNHHLVTIDKTKYLEKILFTANQGAFHSDLKNILIKEGFSKQDSEAFIDELINEQVLFSELEPSVTGANFLDQILKIINNIKGINKQVFLSGSAREKLNQLRNITNEPVISKYQHIKDELSELGTKFIPKFLFNVDLKKNIKSCSLDINITKDLLQGIAALLRLSPEPVQTELSRFRDAFYKRYEEREIPLSEALDPETGIPYNKNSLTSDYSPLIDDLFIPSRQTRQRDSRWNPVYDFIISRYQEVLYAGSTELHLNDRDLEPYKVNWNNMPDTFNVMFRIIHDKKDTEDPYLHLINAAGPSAACLLGRFCHLDKKILDHTLNIIRFEQEYRKDVVLAEIIHLPQDRTGNILLRPILREYEIPYLAKPGVSPDKQIKLDNLMISVRNGRLILRSNKLNRRILPRLCSAHNFSFNALPVYQFLCDLQSQNIHKGLEFSWGPLEERCLFYPRVTYKNIILSPARWNFRKEHFQDLLQIKDKNLLFNKIQNWYAQYKLPSKVLLGDYDNELLIHFKNKLSVQTLISLIKNRASFQLSEFLFDPEKAVVTGENGIYNHECLASFFKQNINES